MPPPVPEPPNASQCPTLDRIARGGVVRVVDIDAEADDPIARRLDDLGLRAGVVVEVVRRAPLGDPTVFALHGYQLCLRRTESARVRVTEPAPTTGPGAARDRAPGGRPGEG